MLVYAGIDEAGYGPLLGPLCVACSVFVLPEYDPGEGAPDLWTMLSRAVCRAGKDRAGRIAIDDSKKLKGANSARSHPLLRLERGVLAFLPDMDVVPASDDALYNRLGVEVPPHGWYRDPIPLPLANESTGLQIDAARLRRQLDLRGVRFEGFACEAIDAGEFNAGVSRMGTKAAVNLGAALRHVQRIRRRFPEHHPRIVIDRHGGRIRYREDLQLAFPKSTITILAESERLSRYRLADDEGALTVSFAVEAESNHLPVALASMTAKYVRELMMARLNRYFRTHHPALKPTAGYVTDGRRFLKDVEPLIRSLRIDSRALVRRC